MSWAPSNSTPSTKGASMLTDEERCELARKLSKDEETAWSVIQFIRNLPEECACDIIDKFSKSKHSTIRSEVAQYQTSLPQKCACDIIKRLANDEYYHVAGLVAKYQTNLPEDCACDIFETLTKNDNPSVRDVVACQPKLPEECACDIIHKLSDDEHRVIRLGAVNNPLYKRCDHAQ